MSALTLSSVRTYLNQLLFTDGEIRIESSVADDALLDPAQDLAHALPGTIAVCYHSDGPITLAGCNASGQAYPSCLGGFQTYWFFDEFKVSVLDAYHVENMPAGTRCEQRQKQMAQAVLEAGDCEHVAMFTVRRGVVLDSGEPAGNKEFYPFRLHSDSLIEPSCSQHD